MLEPRVKKHDVHTIYYQCYKREQKKSQTLAGHLQKFHVAKMPNAQSGWPYVPRALLTVSSKINKRI
ncbi:hypothetical protein Hanom_Chr14g01283571 [Helianthus anomalus]